MKAFLLTVSPSTLRGCTALNSKLSALGAELVIPGSWLLVERNSALPLAASVKSILPASARFVLAEICGAWHTSATR